MLVDAGALIALLDPSDSHHDDCVEALKEIRELYAALWEVGDACRHLDLPPLPALVVRADTR